MNILQRGGDLTKASDYLSEELGGKLHERSDFETPFPLIDFETPSWKSLIRGDDTRGYVPAKEFLESILPQALPEYAFIAQLILPEAAVCDILPESDNKLFIEQRVDFYLPQAFLIIEIDGSQHQEANQALKDKQRDQFLGDNGLSVIRIAVRDIREQNGALRSQIEKIREILEANKRRLHTYRENADKPFASLPDDIRQFKLKPAAVLRFQLLMLELMHRGTVRPDDSEWHFNIRTRDIDDFVQLAFDDLWTWLQPLLRLLAPKKDGDTIEQQFDPTHRPKLLVRQIGTTSEFPCGGGVNVDFSLLKRWTDEVDQRTDVLFVRTDYIDFYRAKRNDKLGIVPVNHFRLSSTTPVQYEIVYEGPYENESGLTFFLKNIFGYDSFRAGQLAIIINALSRRDTIGLLPTGSGKSICYQLPALLQPAVSFVVCPIKALMRDQADDLKGKGVSICHTAFISSDLKGDEKAIAQRNFSEGRYFFVFISPERFQTQSFRDDMQQLARHRSIAYAVLDEAHCLSEWGHDFRTSYLNLTQTIRRFADSANILALTATASLNVLKDLQVEIGTTSEDVKTLADYSRPELSFEVIDDKQRKQERLVERLKQFIDKGMLVAANENSACGLIFTPNVNGTKGCHQVANRLTNQLAQSVEWYAGSVPVYRNYVTKEAVPVMTEEDFGKYRQRVQDGYKKNEFGLLVATKAFGMGINKANIRFTCHYGLPASMESLYQEAGRAGRDKNAAECLIFLTKEQDQEIVEKLLSQHTFLDELKSLRDEVPRNSQHDLLSQLFLLTNGLSTVKDDLLTMERVVGQLRQRDDRYKTEFKLYPSTLKIGNEKVEKAVYRLKLLGLVTDWTVSWATPFSLTVYTHPDWTESLGEKLLLSHILNYNPDFSLIDFQKLYADRLVEGTDFSKLASTLLVWTYIEIVYNRKQSLKTVYEQCCRCTNGDLSAEKFKEYLEDYFRFDDFSYISQSIFEQSVAKLEDNAVQQWFYNFYRLEKVVSKKSQWFLPQTQYEKEQARIVTTQEQQTMQAQLSRFLESKSDNLGLNILSGLLRALGGQYENSDGRLRFEKALAIGRQRLSSSLQHTLVEGCISVIAHVSDEVVRYEILKSILQKIPDCLGDINQVAVRLNLPVLIIDSLTSRLKRIKKINRSLYETIK